MGLPEPGAVARGGWAVGILGGTLAQAVRHRSLPDFVAEAEPHNWRARRYAARSALAAICAIDRIIYRRAAGAVECCGGGPSGSAALFRLVHRDDTWLRVSGTIIWTNV